MSDYMKWVNGYQLFTRVWQEGGFFFFSLYQWLAHSFKNQPTLISGHGRTDSHTLILRINSVDLCFLSVRGDQKERTAAAPTERPGSKRTSEMRLLYGKGAAMIHGMETALQMNFDRNLDVLQPSLWPNMPFRVIFD